MKKIGVFGSGVVARTLASGFLKFGYDVKVGTSHPEKLADWQKTVQREDLVVSFQDAARHGEILVLAVKGSVALSLLESIGQEILKDKIIIDASNPIADVPPESGVLQFFTEINFSLMESLQNAFPQSSFVKSFSCVGSHFMVEPKFDDGIPTMFICGNSVEAKTEVKDILTKFGWEYEDMGPASAARAIEPLCMLWCIPGFQNNQWNHAFKLLKK